MQHEHDQHCKPQPTITSTSSRQSRSNSITSPYLQVRQHSFGSPLPPLNSDGRMRDEPDVDRPASAVEEQQRLPYYFTRGT